MLRALVLAITDRDHTDDLFVARDIRLTFAALVCTCHPAGVQSHHLCCKDNLLPIVSASDIEVRHRFGPDNGDIILHVFEHSVMCQQRVETFRIIHNQLHTKAALLIALRDEHIQFRSMLFRNRLVLVIPDTVALPDRFFDIHFLSPHLFFQAP